MLQKTFGIVLRSIKYSDSSIIVDMFTEQQGRVSYLVVLPRSKKSSLRSVFFQPLSVLEYESDFRPKQNLQRMKDVRLLYMFSSLPYNPYKASIALFLAEFLYFTLREELQNVPLFAYLSHSVRWLDGCKKTPANFHLVFLMRFSRFLGLYPNLEGYHEGDFFDLRAATFTSSQPLHSDFVCPEEASRLGKLMRMNYETMHLFEMSRAERNLCVEIILAYYRLHLPGFPELKSLDVLRELFS